MAAPALKHLEVKDVNGVAVVDFVDSELMFASELVQEISDELQSLVSNHGYDKILLDFSRVQYLSSTMLSQFVKLERLLANAKGQLKLTGLGPILRDTFRISHFESMFAIYDDRDTAIKAFH
jgi:anti-sigma B factor antagonist